MADTTKIVNLMMHAADRLGEENAELPDLLPAGASSERRDQAASLGAALAYAEAVLRTVAAALDEGPSDD